MEAATSTPHRALETPRARPLDRLRSGDSLVDRFRAGDDAAFGALYARHRSRVFAICMGVLGSREDAQDATQEVFAKVAHALRRQPPDELPPWIARIARNTAIDLARTRRPIALVELDDPPALPRAEEGGEELRELLSALRALPERQRSALVMRELGGYSYAEIGQALEVDEVAVTGLIARARANLRGHQESAAMECHSVRERLAAEADGRRRAIDLRRHLRGCDGCRQFHADMRADRRSLRALSPFGGLGLWHAFIAWRGSRAVLVGGVATKGALSAETVKVAAVCALCAGGAGGLGEIVLDERASRDGEKRAVAEKRQRPATAATRASAGAPSPKPAAETPTDPVGPAPAGTRERPKAERRRRAATLPPLRDDDFGRHRREPLAPERHRQPGPGPAPGADAPDGADRSGPDGGGHWEPDGWDRSGPDDGAFDGQGTAGQPSHYEYAPAPEWQMPERYAEPGHDLSTAEEPAGGELP